MSIIEELYYHVCRSNTGYIKDTPQIQELNRYIIRHEKDLTKTLDSSEMEIFEKYRDCQEELCDITAYKNFLAGFSLGINLIMEATQHNKSDNYD